MNQFPASGIYTVANGISSSNPFVEVFKDRAPTVNDVNYPVQKRWLNTVTQIEYILIGFTCSQGVLQANWVDVSTGPSGAVSTLTGDAGGAVSPTLGNINLSGASTTYITGTPGTSTLKTEVVSTLNTFLLGQGATATSIPLGPLTNGQLIIGGTGVAPAAATLTAGAGVTITNASNSITIAASGAAFTWVDVTGTTQTIQAERSYLADNAISVTFTLPASATIGDVFRIVGIQGSWTIAQNANQQIKFGTQSTTVGVGGSLSSNDAGDCVECVATNTSASTIWRVMSSIGNIAFV